MKFICNSANAMTLFKHRLTFKTGLLFLSLFNQVFLFSQSFNGRVFSSETKSGISFVNVGIIGKNVGTVTDQSGNFTLEIDNIYNNDSIRFSMIGYEPKSFLVSTFK